MPANGNWFPSVGMILCQNESITEESIKEAKALCACSIREPETTCAHSIREAKTTCAHSIKEAEACCSTAIREAEAWGAPQTSSIQQSHAKGIQHLEEEAIEEESKGQLNFLSTCQAALEASPLESCGVLLASYQVLQDAHQYLIFSASPPNKGPSPGLLPLLPILHQGLHQTQAMATLTRSMDILPLSKAMSKATPKGPPSSKQWEITLLHKVLMRSHQRAFS